MVLEQKSLGNADKQVTLMSITSRTEQMRLVTAASRSVDGTSTVRKDPSSSRPVQASVGG